MNSTNTDSLENIWTRFRSKNKQRWGEVTTNFKPTHKKNHAVFILYFKFRIKNIL